MDLNQTSASTWPFQPNCISNNIVTDIESCAGVIPNEELRGFLTITSANLTYPCTVYEFYNGESFRTDSILEEYDLIKPCRCFRKCANNSYCMSLDKGITELFRDIERIDIVSSLKERLKSLSLIDHWRVSEATRPTIEIINKRNYLYYDCPFLGYRELVFPIYNKNIHPKHKLSNPNQSSLPESNTDNVIGVFILGQICIEENEDLVNKSRNEFLNRIGFSKLDKISKQNADIWKRKSKKGKLKSIEEYVKLIENIDIQLSQFENTIYRRLYQRRESYALTKIDNAITALHENIPQFDLSLSNNVPLQDFWNNISKRLIEIKNDFNFNYIALFATDDPLSFDENKLPLVSDSSGKSIDQMSFYLTDLIPDGSDRKDFSSLYYPDLHKGLPLDLKNNHEKIRNTVLSYPLPFHPKTPIIIVFQHKISFGPSDYKFLESAFRTLNAAIVSILSSFLARLAELKTINSFRVLRHETDPNTQGLKGLANQYLKDIKVLQSTSEKKGMDICQDIDDYLDRINFLFANARNLLTLLLEKKKIPLKPGWIRIVGEIIYKFKDLFRVYFEERGMDMPLDKAEDTDRWPPIYADRRLLDLLLFNLLNNAYKYGNLGSNIYTDYYMDYHEGREYHTICITNFGVKIESNNDIFKLFVRSTNSYQEEGAGIGLAIVKAVAESHDGTIEFDQEEICPFNLPFIDPFLHYFEIGGRVKLGSKKEVAYFLRQIKERYNMDTTFDDFVVYLKQINNQITGGTKRRVISRNFGLHAAYYPFPNQCLDNLLIPTFRVSFYIRIPKYKQ